MKNHHQFKELCQKHEWRCTPQRLAIYNFVCENTTHPGVDDVWSEVKKSLPSVTRESVYRILNEFAGVGIIQRIDRLSSARYDSQTGPHGHFICEVCGEISDFDLPDVAIPLTVTPGDARHIELRISGICCQCKRTILKEE